MGWKQLTFETTRPVAEVLDSLLQENGACAVTFESADQEALFQSVAENIPLWNVTRITGLFDEETIIPEVINALETALAPTPLPAFRSTVVDDEDWSRAWMSRFEPIQFGPRLWICPSWEMPPDPEAINICLDPGRAFGTGTHPTTALCLKWLDRCSDLRNVTVIDYGCGSGILAIAAARLGASRITAVDVDEDALLVTRENAHKNAVQDLVCAVSAEAFSDQHADLLLANILAGPLLELAPLFSRLVRPGGQLVLSGILREQVAQCLDGYAAWFTMGEPEYQEEWVLLAGIRNGERPSE